MRYMKTYLITESLTAALPNKQQLKNVFASVLTLSMSLALLANSSYKNFAADTSGASGADLLIKNTPGTLIAGNASNDQFSLPLVMTAYNVYLDNNKVSITWTTGMEKRLSYFAIEKSTNGTDFKETALIFA